MSQHAKSAHRLMIEWKQALVYWVTNSAHRSNDDDVFDLPGVKLLTPRYGLLTRTRTMSGWTLSRTWSSRRLSGYRASRARAKVKYQDLAKPSNVDFRGRRLAPLLVAA